MQLNNFSRIQKIALTALFMLAACSGPNNKRLVGSWQESRTPCGSAKADDLNHDRSLQMSDDRVVLKSMLKSGCEWSIDAKQVATEDSLVWSNPQRNQKNCGAAKPGFLPTGRNLRYKLTSTKPDVLEITGKDAFQHEFCGRFVKNN